MPSNNSGIGGMGSEVCPTEDTILALLELLKEPVLTGGKPPSPAQEAYVAKQVQAVVLLYNYHHRRQKPELEFLDFVSFCKLAVIFRPSLLRYMKLMRRDDYAELVDLKKELSLLEKMVMEACDVCKGLDTPEDIVARRHISKVAVFLVDHMKENCFLLQSTYTLGAWSVIEREYNLGAENEATSEEKPVTKRKRITKKPLKGSRSLDESVLQQLAFAAVKDACGCSGSDLEILESHTVYSLSKEKTAARFFIIQWEAASNGSSYIPIRDVINRFDELFKKKIGSLKKDKNTAENNTLLLKRSQRELYRALSLCGTVEAVSTKYIRVRYHEICCSLQGPLVKKEACRWVATSAVQHFHLLPYADIISSWFSRKETLLNSHAQGLVEQNHEEPNFAAVHEDDGSKKLHNALVLHALEAPSKISQTKEKHNGKADPKDRSVLERIDARELTKISPNVTFATAYNGQVLGSGTQNTELTPYSLQSGHQATCKAEDPVQTVVYKRRNKSLNQHGLGEYAIWKQAEAVKKHCKTEDKECAGSCLPSDMEVDDPSAIACSVDRECRSSSSTGEVRLTNGMNRLPSPTTVAVKENVVGVLQNGAEKSGGNGCSEHKAVSLNQYKAHDQALVPFGSNPKGFDKVHEVILSKGNMLSQAALKVVHRRRDMLCHQLRVIQDEIALCDRNIQTILSGGDDSLAVALDTVIEACSDVGLCDDAPAHDATHLQVQDQDSFECLKRRRICKANLSMQNPHQEL